VLERIPATSQSLGAGVTVVCGIGWVGWATDTAEPIHSLSMEVGGFLPSMWWAGVKIIFNVS